MSLTREQIQAIVNKMKHEHFPTMIEKCFETGYDRGFLDGLYAANKIIQATDIWQMDVLDDIIKEYEDRNL